MLRKMTAPNWGMDGGNLLQCQLLFDCSVTKTGHSKRATAAGEDEILRKNAIEGKEIVSL